MKICKHRIRIRTNLQGQETIVNVLPENLIFNRSDLDHTNDL